uniref:Uncharacterized protein n=1 Tax=virus sp. ctML55 TaxID=2827627 RepID=A0A8S5RIM6_9VIRU|nr:MAG TPA: hypothetical protein [virus sp. ctML55]DAJ95459.1 MAG TPA: hypothetical protein [Caudoviricetes sp.]
MDSKLLPLQINDDNRVNLDKLHEYNNPLSH